MLDKTNKKLMRFLSENCRQTLGTSAKNLRTSKATVAYRIKELERKGIIKGYLAVIDFDKLGKQYSRFQIKLTSEGKDKQNEILAYLKKLPELAFLITFYGKYDIGYTIYFNSLKDLDMTTRKVHTKIGKFIKMQRHSLGTCIVHCVPRSLFIGKPIEPVTVNYYGNDITSQTDKKILLALHKHAKDSILDLAKQCGITTKTFLARKRELEKNKVILRYQADIDTNKLGLETYHIIWKFNAFDEKQIRSLSTFLCEQPETKYVINTVGTSWLECECLLRSQHELYAYIERIRKQYKAIIQDYEYVLIAESIVSA